MQTADSRGRGPSGPVSEANQGRETTGFNSKACQFARAEFDPLVGWSRRSSAFLPVVSRFLLLVPRWNGESDRQ